MKLDPNKVPDNVRSYIPYAEKWGISDDGYRGDAVDNASTKELQDLVQFIDDHDLELEEWLAGPESNARPVSSEYVAFTCLRMAAMSAETVLKKRDGTYKPPSREQQRETLAGLMKGIQQILDKGKNTEREESN